VQQALGGGPKASKGSLSESLRVFDPRLLEGLFQELLDKVPALSPAHAKMAPEVGE